MKNSAIDLSACDTEPIHLIGSIQPHGALIAADMESLKIRFASANCGAVLGLETTELLSMTLGDVFAPQDLENLQSRDLTPRRPELIKPLPLMAPVDRLQGLDCLPHRQGDLIVIEFMDHEASPAAIWEQDDLRQRIISELVRPETLGELARLSADIIRRVIGFDRVMIYRFAEDKHGEVIAESTNRPDSFLGLHYPASDIPEPARRHFVQNVVRTIGDINAPSVPVLGPDGTTSGAEAPYPLDLTFSKLRAVAPVHVQYLSNMGVAASMSISLTLNDQLWGLVACHHYSPRLVSLEIIRFCELLGGTISALLQGIETRMQLRRSIEAEKIAFDMEKQGRAGAPLATVVSDWQDDLMQLLDAQGVVLRQGETMTEFGGVPQPRLRYRPLRVEMNEGIAISDHLISVMDLTEAQRQTIAGAGYMELSEDGADYLVAVREQYEHIINWAGKPEKIEERLADGTIRLSPRGSFSLWREERVGRSKPFDPTDREALRIIRRALFALNSLERERAAVRAQKEAEAEEERLRLALMETARRASLGELASVLAHELNQPLAAVTNYVAACRQEFKNHGKDLPDSFDTLMREAVSEATRAADLVRRLRNFIAGGQIAIESMDLHAAVRQGLDLALVAHGADPPELHLDLDPDMPAISGDAVQIGQVVLNLATNAITAMRGRAERILTIRTLVAGDMARIEVTDTGGGISPRLRGKVFEPFHASTTSGMGIGLSLCRSIVEAHGGRIWADDVPRGARLVVALPIRGRLDDRR